MTGERRGLEVLGTFALLRLASWDKARESDVAFCELSFDTSAPKECAGIVRVVTKCVTDLEKNGSTV